MAPHVLKRISLIFSLLLISILATAQQKVNGNTAFIRSFEKNFKLPDSFIQTCFYEVITLRVSLSHIAFSDNASNELKAELKRIENKLDINSLKENKNVGKHVDLIFPVFFINKSEECKGKYNVKNSEQAYCSFGGYVIDGPVQLQEPIILNLYNVVN